MKRHSLIIAVSMLLGLVVAIVLYGYLVGLRQEARKKRAEQSATNAVWVVAKQDIPFRGILTAEMLDTVQVPSNVMQEGAVTRLQDAVGKSAVAPIVKGQFLMTANLRATVPGSDLGFLVPAGYRAITVETSVVAGVGQLLKPDDMVDLLVYLDQKDVGKDMSFVFIRGLRVLATDQTLTSGTPAAKSEEKGLASNIGGEKKGYTSVTLAATPEDCVKINLAEAMGRIRLALRPVNAEEETMEPDFISYPSTLSSGLNINPQMKMAQSNYEAAPAPARVRKAAAKPQPRAPEKQVVVVYKTAPAQQPAAPKGKTVTIIRGFDVSNVYVENKSQQGGR